jgi:uncharacterized protein (DUF849 family)
MDVGGGRTRTMAEPKNTILTCAITGNQTRPDQNPALPITPKQIADSALEAAAAGAAIVHIHVRHPDGRPSMEVEHYRDVVDRIRGKNSEVIINLTTGPGGRFHPTEGNPSLAGPRTNLLVPERRVQHVLALRPDICTLDLNTMVFGSEVVINTPSSIEKMAAMIYEAGVIPELELFDTGDIHLMQDLLARGVIARPSIACLVLGVRYGFPATSQTMTFACSLLPADVAWTGFGIGRHAFPMLAQSYLLGGNLRIGMEDTAHYAKSRLALSNAELVEKARWLVEKLGGRLATASEARARLCPGPRSKSL